VVLKTYCNELSIDHVSSRCKSLGVQFRTSFDPDQDHVVLLFRRLSTQVEQVNRRKSAVITRCTVPESDQGTSLEFLLSLQGVFLFELCE